MGQREEDYFRGSGDGVIKENTSIGRGNENLYVT